MAEKNYYDILGITDEEKKLPDKEFEDVCKKKYRKLSMQYHPDRFATKSEKEQKEAEEKFKDIAEAYRVLSNPDERAKYDNPNAGFDDFGGFEDFGGFGFGFNPFNPFGQRQQQRVNVGENLTINLTITIQDAYNGLKRNITYQRMEHCPDCNGTGSADGKETVCPHCNGTGMIREESSNGFMHTINMRPCHHCNGTGKLKTNPCKSCKGTGLKLKTVTETIDIPKGIFNGAQLVVNGKGNAPQGQGINGKLIINVTISDDPYFKVEEGTFNVIHYEYINFNEALLGCEKEIKFLDGTTKKIKIPECTKDNNTFTYNGYGMYNIQLNNGTYGNYKVIIKHVYPKKLTNEQKKILEEWKW